jgi:endoglucanase
MRRLARLLVVSTLTACGAGPIPEAMLDWSTPVEPTPAPARLMPRLRVDGRQLLEAGSGRQVRLRGVNVCSFEYDLMGSNWRSGALLAPLADPQRWRANVVRMPVNQQWFLEDDAYVARIEQLIDLANVAGLYVIVDVQWEVGRKLDPYHANILPLPTFGEGNTTEAFWRKATSRWANRTNLLYDLINEPHDYPDDVTAQAMQALVDAIRTRDTSAVIVVAGMNWAHTVDYYRTRPLRGANLVYSAHQYLPYDPADEFAARFGAAAQTLPVLIGEFTAEPSSVDYARALVETAESQGVVGWLPWAVGCGFDVDDDTKREPLIYLARRMRELNL